MRVVHKSDVFHIASTKVDDVGSGTDESGEANRCVLSRATVLFHGKQQEVSKVFLGVELEIIEKQQITFFLDKHVEVAVADLNRNACVNAVFHHAVEEYAARMGNPDFLPFGL